MRRFVVPLLLVALAAPVSARAAATSCVFSAQTPGYAVARVDLPNGADSASIRLAPVTRAGVVLGDRSSWHLAMGFAIIDAATHEIVTSRIYDAGSSTRRAVVSVNGSDVVRQDVLAPDVSFVHTNWIPVDRLAPGSYLFVGFGSDGSAADPDVFWGAESPRAEPIDCPNVATGDVFDIDHTMMTGGDQVSASVAGVAQDVRATYTTARALTFGLMDVAQQGAGSATLDYSIPGSSGTISNAIVPFVAGAGTSTFTASFAGVAPLIDISGVSFDL